MPVAPIQSQRDRPLDQKIQFESEEFLKLFKLRGIPETAQFREGVKTLIIDFAEGRSEFLPIPLDPHIKHLETFRRSICAFIEQQGFDKESKPRSSDTNAHSGTPKDEETVEPERMVYGFSPWAFVRDPFNRATFRAAELPEDTKERESEIVRIIQSQSNSDYMLDAALQACDLDAVLSGLSKLEDRLSVTINILENEPANEKNRAGRNPYNNYRKLVFNLACLFNQNGINPRAVHDPERLSDTKRFGDFIEGLRIFLHNQIRERKMRDDYFNIAEGRAGIFPKTESIWKYGKGRLLPEWLDSHDDGKRNKPGNIPCKECFPEEAAQARAGSEQPD